MLSVPARTRKELSKVDAHWDLLPPIIDAKNTISPDTLIVGNGDVKNRADGIEKANISGVDGIMIGRGIFHDPYCFTDKSPWEDMSPREKIQLYIKHVELFLDTYPTVKKFEPLKKFSKVYLHGFENASEIRDKVVRSRSPEEMLAILKA